MGESISRKTAAQGGEQVAVASRAAAPVLVVLPERELVTSSGGAR